MNTSGMSSVGAVLDFHFPDAFINHRLSVNGTPALALIPPDPNQVLYPSTIIIIQVIPRL